MKQTLFTYQEQSAISIIRFLFDLFYIKPATLINTKTYTNNKDQKINLGSENTIITKSYSHSIILFQSCDFIDQNKKDNSVKCLENNNDELVQPSNLNDDSLIKIAFTENGIEIFKNNK